MIGGDNVAEARRIPAKRVREVSEVAYLTPDTVLAPLVSGLVDQHVFETLDGSLAGQEEDVKLGAEWIALQILSPAVCTPLGSSPSLSESGPVSCAE